MFLIEVQVLNKLNMIDFFIKVKQQEAQNLPFVIYSKPN